MVMKDATPPTPLAHELNSMILRRIKTITSTMNVVLDDNDAGHAATVNYYIVNMVKGCVIMRM